jgi:chorismate mutase
VLHARAQADPFEGLARQAAALAVAHAAVEQGQLDVVDHAQVRNQVEALEDEAEGAVAQASPLPCRGRR